MGDKKNVIEDITADLLEKALALRFDICRCLLCTQKMKEAVVEKFPSYFVDPQSSDYRETLSRLNNEYFRPLLKEVMEVVDVVGKNPPHPVGGNREEEFKQLLERIYQDRGLDFSQYHRKILKRRVALRLRTHKLSSYAEYLRVLAEVPDEYDKLFEVLTINISGFFRDKPVWVRIEAILKELARGNKESQEPIAIWSAGCARGEESYSLAILAKELGIAQNIEIYATDIDGESILAAREGRYDTQSVKNVSKVLLKKYFERNNEEYSSAATPRPATARVTKRCV